MSAPADTPSRPTPPEGWRWFGAFAGLCLLVTLIRLLWAGASDLWNGADSLFYAVLGRNLAEGRGFVVDHIRFFFTRYETVANRPDDWLSPLFPLSMVPFIKLWGPTYLAYSAPAILCGGLGLPLVTRALAYRCGAGRWVAMAAGVTALFHPMLFLGSQSPMTDVPFAFLVALCLYWYLRLDEGYRAAVLAGLFLGGAALVRPVALYLFPLLPLCNLLRVRRARALVAPEILSLLGAAVLVMLPWLIRNQVLFGSPMHSIYSYVGPLAGRADARMEDTYNFWWDSRLPRMSDRYGGQPWGIALSYVIKYLLWGFDMTFVGLIKGANIRALIGLNEYNYHLYHGLLGIPSLFALWGRRREWVAKLALLVLFGLILMIALVNLPATPRYFFSSYPLVIVYGWLGWDQLARAWDGRFGRRTLWLGLLLALLVLSGAGLDVLRGQRMQLPYDPNGRAAMLATREAVEAAATWVPEGEPILFNPNPAQVNLFARRPAVAVPRHATPEQVKAVIDYYGIDYALVYPDVAVWLDLWGWEMVYQNPRLTGLRRRPGE